MSEKIRKPPAPIDVDAPPAEPEDTTGPDEASISLDVEQTGDEWTVTLRADDLDYQAVSSDPAYAAFLLGFHVGASLRNDEPYPVALNLLMMQRTDDLADVVVDDEEEDPDDAA